jgi:hypothetical protein
VARTVPDESHAQRVERENAEAERVRQEAAASADRFILAYLADPDWTKEQKEKKKAAHHKQWGTKPWEKPQR